MFKNLARCIRLELFKKRYRYFNKNNSTTAETYFPIKNVSVGRNTYGPLKIIWMALDDVKVQIGNYCSIGPSVTFLVGGEHNYRRISTWPFQTLIYHEHTVDKINRDIIIEDDVWIGYDSLILSGVTIGKGSVIGARSVVAKDVPPYSIYVGNKVIKKRFSDEIIEKISKIDYSRLNHVQTDLYKKYCQVEVTESNLNEILKEFNR